MRLPTKADVARLRVNLPTVRGHRVTWPMVAGVVAVALGLGVGTAWGISSLTAAKVATPPAPVASPSTVAAPSTPSTPSPTASPGIRPGDIIATSTVDSLGVYAAPGDATPTTTLGKWSNFLQPLTLMGTEVSGTGAAEWIKVDLPVEPNGTTGWIRASDVTTSSTDLSIHIFLDERTLELHKGDEVVMTTTVVVGADATPTPTGLFYVTDPLDFSANPSGVYGSYALGLSGYSDTLTSFAGGPPQIAIHGTNEPKLLGTAASHGCVRLPNDKELELAHAVVLGTPVYIESSRTGA